MKYIPKKPDPDILFWFTKPRSMTQVKRESGWYRETVWAHMESARRLGLIVEAGKHKDPDTSCTHHLYELTPAGIDYMEAHED